MAGVDEKHFTYHLIRPDWDRMRDTMAGQRVIKSKGETYLLPTENHRRDGFPTPGKPGTRAYEAYKARARFPAFVEEAVETALGMLHAEPCEIELPEGMKGIKSSKGEEMPQLLQRINKEQLITGRVGLMLGLPSGSGPPFISTYSAERIINWDTEDAPEVVNLVVLDETDFQRVPGQLNWEQKNKYRVLMLQEGVYTQNLYTEDWDFNPNDLIAPSHKGRELEKVPFVFVNTTDVVSEPDNPPLLDLANICLTMYSTDADYRQSLFMQSQDTLVTINAAIQEDDELQTGAGARIDLQGEKSDAKYIGVNSQGLKEQREATQDLEARAGSMGAQSLDSTSRERESGDSLRVRVAARTASLNQLAESGAEGLEQILRDAAVWMGENPDEVRVKPNKEFGEAPLTSQSMVEMQNARNLGYPISARSLHELALRRRVTQRTYEEELEEAKAEKDSLFGPQSTGDRNQNREGIGSGSD